jgi:hypothetical protein
MIPPTPHRRAPQSRAVVVLSVALAVLVALWVVGGYVLYEYAHELGELPGTAPSTPR